MSINKFFVGKSKIDGRGLFANCDMKRGDFIFFMKGRIIKMNDKNRDAILKKPNVVGIGRKLWIDPIRPYVFANHSCDPTMGVKGRIKFVALRDIRKGEELTFDYSISEDTDWEMACRCGSKKCRGVIKGTKYLPEECFVSYWPFFPTYFKKLYLEYHQDFKKINRLK